MIARRLKNGGCWKVRRVNRMANLCATIYSDHWDSYWKSAYCHNLELHPICDGP
jgi:hypothetical protein